MTLRRCQCNCASSTCTSEASKQRGREKAPAPSVDQILHGDKPCLVRRLAFQPSFSELFRGHHNDCRAHGASGLSLDNQRGPGEERPRSRIQVRTVFATFVVRSAVSWIPSRHIQLMLLDTACIDVMQMTVVKNQHDRCA